MGCVRKEEKFIYIIGKEARKISLGRPSCKSVYNISGC
jgi:hypothetical protein